VRQCPQRFKRSQNITCISDSYDHRDTIALMGYGHVMNLSDDELERYARHIVLREVGGVGQAKLKAARVLVIGAGGLGSPMILYLAAAGIGTIGIVDDDAVSLSNLQRQIVHRTADVGRPKTTSAGDAAQAINPSVVVELHPVRLDPSNALDLISRYDVIADGSDNFATRFLVNDACFFARKALVSAAVTEFDGQLATFKAFDSDYPCYRCIFPEPPPPGTAPSCSETGVLGAAAGVMGTLQAMEVLKEIVRIGESMAGHLLIYDALTTSFRRLRVKPDSACALCGSSPTIVDLSAHNHQA
jgi:adenylyltransferase/sulfurtransferase